MKTLTEYIQKKHITSMDEKYKNPNWKEWKWGNMKIPEKEYDATYQFVKEKYGDLSVESFIKLAEDYYLDYLNVSYPDRKHNDTDAKDVIDRIKDNADDYNDSFHPSFGQGFIDFIYKNCII